MTETCDVELYALNISAHTINAIKLLYVASGEELIVVKRRVEAAIEGTFDGRATVILPDYPVDKATGVIEELMQLGFKSRIKK